jgi:hypothetical protein
VLGVPTPAVYAVRRSADLVASGLIDRDIAAALVISEAPTSM